MAASHETQHGSAPHGGAVAAAHAGDGHAPAGNGHGGGTHHPSTRQYIFIAVLLFLITIVEFVIIMDFPGESEKVIADALGSVATTVLLFVLSGIKFAIVILFYMHLKFDHPLFLRVFLAGLVLALMVGLALIGLFTAIVGESRDYAEARAVPFEHHAEGDHAGGAVTGGPLSIDVLGDALTFTEESFDVNAGDAVTLNFVNSSATNQHNWVLVRDGTKDLVATNGTAAGPVNGWLDPADADVLAATALLDPGASEELVFTAPAAGVYQFVCTFPGHNITMFGDFIVH